MRQIPVGVAGGLGVGVYNMCGGLASPGRNAPVDVASTFIDVFFV